MSDSSSESESETMDLFALNENLPPSPTRRRVEAATGKHRYQCKNRQSHVEEPTNQDLPATSAAGASDSAVAIQVPQPLDRPNPQHLSHNDTESIPLSIIQQEAHANQLELQQGLDKGKGTEEAYPRHVKNYVKFWEDDQDRQAKDDPNYVKIPAHPIIGENVAVFLQHRLTRNKRNSQGKDIAGTSVGKEHIKQTISVLQRYMLKHQHEPEYYNCPATRIPLRSQLFVKTYEAAATSNEKKRVKDSHVLKARGSSNNTYTVQELIKMSVWTLQTFGPSRYQTHLGLCDRAMLLISTMIAFRGDSTRLTLFSDLFFCSIAMGNIGVDIRLQTLGIMADQSKTNSTSRVDEHGIFRHCLVELCGFSGIGFYLFSHFHIVNKAPPLFIPDFDDPEHTEFGRCDWYKMFLFPGKDATNKPSGTNPMTYDNHHECVASMHTCNGVQVSAVTHAGRPYTAIMARKHGAAALDTKVLGHWKTGDAYSEVYDCGLPRNVMLASAMFSAENPMAYVLPRGLLVPPTELCKMIFPWAEDELAAYNQRVEELGQSATNYLLKNFLVLLLEFHQILLQDAAVLCTKYPNCYLWSYAPFNTPAFREFAQTSTSIMEEAEQRARHQLKMLPTTLGVTMQGILQSFYSQQSHGQNKLIQWLEFLERMMCSQVISTKGHKRLSYSGSSTPQAPDNHSAISTPSPFAFSGTSTSFDTNFDTTSNHSSSNSTSTTASLMMAATFDSPSSMSSFNSAAEGSLVSELPLFLIESFLLSKDNEERQRQLKLIQILTTKYGPEHISALQFEWMQYATSLIQEEWLPIYVYKRGLSVWEIWEEWADGLDGKLFVQQLSEGWGAHWRQNVQGQKTKASRRKCLIDLVMQLSQKVNWTVQLAICFLEETYPIPGPGYLASPTTFCKQLQNSTKGVETVKEIMEKALSYCK